MTFLIFGLGALGTVYATFLKSAGHTVYGITKEKYLQKFPGKKVRVSGIWGEKEAVLDGVYATIEKLAAEKIDGIVLTVKSYDTARAADQIKPLVKGETLTVVAQNGYGNYETVSGIIGREHTLLARVIFGARLIQTGHTEVTVIADAVRLGQPDNAVDESRIIAVAQTLNAAGIPTAYAPDVYRILWDKILYNCALNPLGALLECSYGTLAAEEGTKRIMDEIIFEIFMVARAQGIPLRWGSPEAYREHFYAKLVPPTKEHFPSMYYDLKLRKKLEIDALNGAIVRLAREKEIQVPVNELVTALIKAKENIALMASDP